MSALPTSALHGLGDGIYTEGLAFPFSYVAKLRVRRPTLTGLHQHLNRGAFPFDSAFTHTRLLMERLGAMVRARESSTSWEAGDLVAREPHKSAK